MSKWSWESIHVDLLGCLSPKWLLCSSLAYTGWFSLWLVWHGSFCIFIRLMCSVPDIFDCSSLSYCFHIASAFLAVQVGMSWSFLFVTHVYCGICNWSQTEVKLQFPVTADSDNGILSLWAAACQKFAGLVCVEQSWRWLWSMCSWLWRCVWCQGRACCCSESYW